MSAEAMHVPDATIAVLIERLDNVIAQQNKLEGMLTAQSTQLGAIPVIQASLTEHGQKFDRAFSALRETAEIAKEANTRSKTHSAIIKGVATLLIACLGLISWGWNQLERFRNEDQALDRRLLKTELKLGIDQPTADGGKE